MLDMQLPLHITYGWHTDAYYVLPSLLLNNGGANACKCNSCILMHMAHAPLHNMYICGIQKLCDMADMAGKTFYKLRHIESGHQNDK